MKVLVTGANGFLGSHVVRALIKEGYEVKAFILNGTSEDNLNGLKYEVFKGDLINSADIEKAVKTCDYVIHTAAITDVCPAKNALSWTINFEVVKTLTKVIRENHIKKFVHVGTANSFGFGTLENPGTEKDDFNCCKYGLDYIDSKKAAQNFLLTEARKVDSLPVVIVNPTFMIGENDSKPGPGEMIISVMTRKVPGYPTGGRCFAAVKDVARGCVQALEKGEIGECYITGGTNLCYKDFFNLIGKIADIKPPKMKIPTFMAVAFSRIVMLFAKIFRKKPKVTTVMARISGDGHYYSSEKAIREIGYSQSSLKTALEEAINWYKTHGYVK